MNANTTCTIKQQCQMLLLAVMLTFVAAGAQANSPELVGEWVRVEGSMENGNLRQVYSIDLDNDGTGERGGIKWKVQSDSLVISYVYFPKDLPDSYKFKISGKKLTLTRGTNTATYENKKEENDKKRAEFGKKLMGSWIRTKGKVADAKYELLDGGTGTSGSSPITWKIASASDRGAGSAGSLKFVKKINGKETAVYYDYTFIPNTESISKYDELILTGDDREKDSDYRRKEDIDEIARIKKEAKQSISFTDSRDKKKYKAVKIDGKIWMAENLNFKTDNSLCFGKKDANCTKYGQLYTWDEAKKACPEGWHLPKKEEWDALLKAELKVGDGSSDNAGNALRAKTGWSAFKGGKNGTNELGFSALPGGYKSGDDFIGPLPGGFKSDFSGNEIGGAWWVDLDKGANAGSAGISTMLEAAGMYSKAKLTGLTPGVGGETPKTDALSVRCVQD